MCKKYIHIMQIKKTFQHVIDITKIHIVNLCKTCATHTLSS